MKNASARRTGIGVNVSVVDVIVRVGVPTGVGVSNGAAVGGKVGICSGVDVGAIVGCAVSVGGGACVAAEQAEGSRTSRAVRMKRIYIVFNNSPT